MILIAPFAKKLRNGGNNPKNFPFWKEVLNGLNGHKVVQVGIEGEEQLTADFRKDIRLSEVAKLVSECATWVSVDNYLPHLAHHIRKPGIVLFGQSDPDIYGYKENINLLKSRSYLRPDQFLIWEQCEYKTDAFVDPQIVLNSIKVMV